MKSGLLFPVRETDPQNYYYYQQGFSPEELARIENTVIRLPFVEATTVGGVDKNTRVSSIKWIPQTEEWNWLYEKLMNMAIEANKALWDFELNSMPEGIQYTEYYATEGGHYTWHQDIGPGMLSHRKISITVQLAGPDEYEGGDLEYWQGGDGPLTAPRGKGVVFIFPSYMMHRVTKVTKGTRKSFVLWLGGGHYK